MDCESEGHDSLIIQECYIDGMHGRCKGINIVGVKSCMRIPNEAGNSGGKSRKNEHIVIFWHSSMNIWVK